MKLYIKYMVSLRYKMLVKDELILLGLQYVTIDLGVIIMHEEITQLQCETLRIRLLNSGLELHDDKKSILIEKIKNVISEMIHYTDGFARSNYSVYISEKLNYDYTYLLIFFQKLKALPFNSSLL